MKRARGFTLIEVLVAVAILAIAMAAIISGMARYTSEAAYLRDKTVAIWVAHNRMTEIQLTPAWPDVGESTGDVEMGGQKWKWRAVVTATQDDRLRRVDLHIQLPPQTGDMATLTAFLSRTEYAK
ncbi:MAG: type II secretion system minor pseudopilin GspI [Stenotrophobium sp.]